MCQKEQVDIVWTRAVQLIACDSHAHLVSKAGSVMKAAMKRPIFIFRITCCYPLIVPTLIKYSDGMLTFKP